MNGRLETRADSSIADRLIIDRICDEKGPRKPVGLWKNRFWRHALAWLEAAVYNVDIDFGVSLSPALTYVRFLGPTARGKI